MPGTRATRKTALQFGEAAGAVLGGIGIFGSEAAGAIEYSLDPALIQSLSQWLDGWSTAVLGGGNPSLEDFNAFCFVFSYFVTYLSRTGIAEWDSATEYFSGDLVRVAGVLAPGLTSPFTVYACVADSASSSVGDSPNGPGANPTKWRPLFGDTPGFRNQQVTAAHAARAVATWTVEASADTSGEWLAIFWCPDLALFISVAFVNSGTAAHCVMTSPDGKTWTARSVADSGTNFYGGCFSSELGLAVIVGANAGNASKQVETSPDGTTWTRRTAAEDGGWTGVCWAGEIGLLLSVSNSVGTHRAMSSPDGVTWTLRQAANASGNHTWNSICWSPQLSLGVAVSLDGYVMTTPDGINWTEVVPSELNSWRQVIWAPELGMFIAVASALAGSNTHQIMVSGDGSNWHMITAPEANQWYALAWSPELRQIVAVAGTGTHRIMNSPDGINWSLQTAAEADAWEGIAWSGPLGIFSAVAVSGTNGTQISKYVKKLISA